MLAHIIIVAVLALLYGLAWHDQPARGPEREERPRKN